MNDDVDGWWDVPPAEKWKCPECGEWSPAEEWEERMVGCDDCGEHDGRECPRCGDVFDHVWGARRIANAMAAAHPLERGVDHPTLSEG